MIKWVNTYIRSKLGSIATSYEWEKLSSICTLPGDKLIMGDINGSQVYSEPVDMWKKKGLGSDSKVMNENMRRIGKKLRKDIAEAGITDISATNEFMWTPTRCSPTGPNNKLDVVMVTNRLVNQQKARVLEIFAPVVEPENFKISDHDMLVMTLKANCSLQINLYTEKESYKTSRIQNSHRIQRLMRQHTDDSAAAIHELMETGNNIQDVVKMMEVKLKLAAETVVGKRKVVRKIGQNAITEHPNAKSARKALQEAKKKEAKRTLHESPPASLYHAQQARQLISKQRSAYYREIRE